MLRLLFCPNQRLRMSAGGQDCIGSTKLALISSYGNQVAPTYIHPNMSLQIEGRWGNCHVLVADPGELGCLPRWPQWWILSSLVTRPSLRNRTLATMEVGIENHTVNPSWCWTPRKAPRKMLVFLIDIFQSGYFGDIEIVNREPRFYTFFAFRTMYLQMVVIRSLGD